MKWYEYEDLINNSLIRRWKKLVQALLNASIRLRDWLVHNRGSQFCIRQLSNTRKIPGFIQEQTHNIQDIYRAFNGKEFFFKLWSYICNEILTLKRKIQDDYLKMDKLVALLTFVLVISIFMFFKTSIITLVKSLSQQEISREISSEKPLPGELPHRPEYHGKSKKELLISNLSVPILVGKNLKVHSINLDISLRCSSRYIKKVLSKTPHLIHDKIYKSFAPIAGDFPITEEGKVIIRNKIKLEINNLIKDLNLNGTIDEVTIHHILSS